MTSCRRTGAEPGREERIARRGRFAVRKVRPEGRSSCGGSAPRPAASSCPGPGRRCRMGVTRIRRTAPVCPRSAARVPPLRSAWPSETPPRCRRPSPGATRAALSRSSNEVRASACFGPFQPHDSEQAIRSSGRTSPSRWWFGETMPSGPIVSSARSPQARRSIGFIRQEMASGPVHRFPGVSPRFPSRRKSPCPRVTRGFPASGGPDRGMVRAATRGRPRSYRFVVAPRFRRLPGKLAVPLHEAARQIPTRPLATACSIGRPRKVRIAGRIGYSQDGSTGPVLKGAILQRIPRAHSRSHRVWS